MLLNIVMHHEQFNQASVIFLHTVKWSNSSISKNSISHLFAHSLNVKQFYLTHRTQSSATTLVQSGTESNGNEEVLHILKTSSITGAYPEHLLSGGALTSLQRSSRCALQPQPTGLIYISVTQPRLDRK